MSERQAEPLTLLRSHAFTLAAMDERPAADSLFDAFGSLVGSLATWALILFMPVSIVYGCINRPDNVKPTEKWVCASPTACTYWAEGGSHGYAPAINERVGRVFVQNGFIMMQWGNDPPYPVHTFEEGAARLKGRFEWIAARYE